MSNVSIYSRGTYENLSDLENKAVIRIHNINDKKWYPNQEENKLVLFFNDYRTENISFIDKIKANLGLETRCLNKIKAKEILKYIKENKGKDFIIHCEYGKSRSVAVAIFLRDNLGYTIINKKEEELKHYNNWVLSMLKKFY